MDSDNPADSNSKTFGSFERRSKSSSNNNAASFPSTRQKSYFDPDYSRELGPKEKVNTKLFDPKAAVRKVTPVEASSKHTQTTTPAQKSKSKEGGYNAGYRDRINNIKNPDLFFRSPPKTIQETMQLMEQLFKKIDTLQKNQEYQLDRLRKITRKGDFKTEEWSEFTRKQIQLAELFSDLFYYAASVSAIDTNFIVKNAIKQNKIPTKFWNKGISFFIDAVRVYSPASNTILATFVINCMNLLMPLTSIEYDTRHIWIECLGDLALICLIANIEQQEDWHSMCMYWYQRRTLLTSGTGRLYHHLASIAEPKFDCLFYVCKGMMCYYPAEFKPETLKSLLVPSRNSRKLDAFSERANTYINMFFDLHFQCLKLKPRDHGNDAAAFASDDSIQPELINRSAVVAYCNISAILSYGDKSTFYSKFLQAIIEKVDGQGDVAMDGAQIPVIKPTREELSQLKWAKKLAFTMLASYLKIRGSPATLQHVVVWMYFLLATAKAPVAVWDFYVSGFPFGLLVDFINDLIAYDTGRPSRFKFVNSGASGGGAGAVSGAPATDPTLGMRSHANPDSAAAVAAASFAAHNASQQPPPPPRSVDEIPLPEEIHLKGFVWTHTITPLLNAFTTPQVMLDLKEFSIPIDEPHVAYHGGPELTVPRIKRIRFLAKRLGLDCPSFNYKNNKLEYLGESTER
ncbi:hypothetical protein DUD61_002012 [Geotrichum candidum]|nr:hypothetical protein DUD61_002012 [Geotrichum candidum]